MARYTVVSSMCRRLVIGWFGVVQRLLNPGGASGRSSSHAHRSGQRPAVLGYIGETGDFEARMADHAAKQPWWDLVVDSSRVAGPHPQIQTASAASTFSFTAAHCRPPPLPGAAVGVLVSGGGLSPLGAGCGVVQDT